MTVEVLSSRVALAAALRWALKFLIEALPTPSPLPDRTVRVGGILVLDVRVAAALIAVHVMVLRTAEAASSLHVLIQHGLLGRSRLLDLSHDWCRARNGNR